MVNNQLITIHKDVHVHVVTNNTQTYWNSIETSEREETYDLFGRDLDVADTSSSYESRESRQFEKVTIAHDLTEVTEPLRILNQKPQASQNITSARSRYLWCTRAYITIIYIYMYLYYLHTFSSISLLTAVGVINNSVCRLY